MPNMIFPLYSQIKKFHIFFDIGRQSISQYKQELLKNKDLITAWDSVAKEGTENIQQGIADAKEQIASIKKDYFLKLGIVALILPMTASQQQEISVPNLPIDMTSNSYQKNQDKIGTNAKSPNKNPRDKLANQSGNKGEQPTKNSKQPAPNQDKLTNAQLDSEALYGSKAEAFIKLVHVTEGKSNVFYLDNVGVATAYGWNPTRNSKEFNTQIAKTIGLPTKETKLIEKISADGETPQVQFVPKQLKNTFLTNKQVNKAALFMMGVYEQQFIRVLKSKAVEKKHSAEFAEQFYKSMPNNQQAVLVHMAYKLGATGLHKYDNFFDKLFVYMDKPTPKNLTKVSNQLTYAYTNRSGEVVRDQKVEKIHAMFFNQCLHKEVPNTSPQDCRDIIDTHKVNIVPPKPVVNHTKPLNNNNKNLNNKQLSNTPKNLNATPLNKNIALKKINDMKPGATVLRTKEVEVYPRKNKP